MTDAGSAPHALRPAELWAAAQARLAALLAGFGTPLALARAVLASDARAALGEKLRALEALARRLLLHLAADAALRAPGRGGGRGPRGARPAIDTADPRTWRVAFRYLPRPSSWRSPPRRSATVRTRAGGQPRRADGELLPVDAGELSLRLRAGVDAQASTPDAEVGSAVKASFALARRAAALQRVLDDPARAARRMARTLAREPRGARRVLAAPRAADDALNLRAHALARALAPVWYSS